MPVIASNLKRPFLSHPRMASPPSPPHTKPLRGLFYILVGFLVAAYCVAVGRHAFETHRDAETSLRYLNTTLVQNTRTTLRNYFDRIFRSVRFNAAFMEIAYFVIRHPEELHEPFENAQLFRNPFSEADAEERAAKRHKRRRR